MLREVCWASLSVLDGGYRSRGPDLQFDGQRPGSEWIGHGYFCRWLLVLVKGRLVRRRLWKRRWSHRVDKRTCHSRPLDELGRISVCSLTFVLVLFGWMQADGGAGQHRAVAPGLEGAKSRRTLERWMRRAGRTAMDSQQAIRLSIIERNEPRPMERLFPRGVSPPEQLEKRGWRDPQKVTTLWRGFAMLLTAAVTLKIPASIVLAEAHRRSATPETPLWI